MVGTRISHYKVIEKIDQGGKGKVTGLRMLKFKKRSVYE